MSTPAGFVRGCRALYSAAKSATSPSPKPNISASGKKPTTVAAPASEEKKSSARGLLRARPVSPLLRSFVGVPEISRAEAIKKVWGYIKLHNLQASTTL